MVVARRIPSDSPDALALVEAMTREIVAAYGPDTLGNTPTATPEDLAPPGGCYVALYDGDRPVAGGGVKRIGDGIGEIKRMFVVPGRRGEGLSRVLLAALEDAARELGFERVRLDTGVKQPQAESLYRSSGYVSIHNYNDNAYASYWGEKVLTP